MLSECQFLCGTEDSASSLTCFCELHYRYEIQEIDNELLQCNGSLDTEGKVYESYDQAVEDALNFVLKKIDLT